MPTIIDALVVELGLNPEPFVRGQKTALAEFKRLKTEASGEVREVEDKARATVTLLGRIQQQALGLGGLLLGGLGLADLVTRFIPLNVELARNAENLGMSARRLAGWEAAAQSVGAPVGSVTKLFQSLNRGIQDFMHGTPNELIAKLRVFGINPLDASGKPRPLEDLAFEIANSPIIKKATPRDRAWLAEQLGIDEGTLELFKKGPALPDYINKMTEVRNLTKAETEEMKKVNAEWVKLKTAVDNVTSALTLQLGPALRTIFDILTKTPDQLISELSGRKLEEWEKAHPYLSGFMRRAGITHTGEKAGGGGEAPAAEPAPPTGSKTDMAAIIASEGRAAGMSEAGIAAAIANAKDESALDPSMRHYDQPNPKFAGTEAAYGHGLFSEGGDEWNNFITWRDKNYPGSDWRDPKLQARFVFERMKEAPEYRSTWQRMQNAHSNAEAYQAFVEGYLKPAAGPMAERITRAYGHGVPNAPPAPAAPAETEKAPTDSQWQYWIDLFWNKAKGGPLNPYYPGETPKLPPGSELRPGAVGSAAGSSSSSIDNSSVDNSRSVHIGSMTVQSRGDAQEFARQLSMIDERRFTSQVNFNAG